MYSILHVGFFLVLDLRGAKEEKSHNFEIRLTPISGTKLRNMITTNLAASPQLNNSDEFLN